MFLRGAKGEGKRESNKPDENKWTASWWKEKRQRRWNWLNQSFISFPPICCAVIGVRVTGRLTPLPSSFLLLPPPSTTVLTHTHARTSISTIRAGFVSLCYGSRGKRLWLGLTNGKNTSPHLPTGTQSLQEQWEVTKVILQLQHSPDGSRGIVICRPKTCMCRTQLRVLPRV